jgi:hypothetical protein
MSPDTLLCRCRHLPVIYIMSVDSSTDRSKPRSNTSLVIASRPASMSLDSGDNAPAEVANEEERHATKRSERKRQREKQRRSDLSNAFDELSAFIVQVEPEGGDQDSDVKKKRKKSDGGEDASGITRLELIGRAIRIMRRLHTENEERKRIIAGIQEKEGVLPNDNVS